jgi:hypothetical protein
MFAAVEADIDHYAEEQQEHDQFNRNIQETSFLSFDRNRKDVIMETAAGQGVPDERTGKKQKAGRFVSERV